MIRKEVGRKGINEMWAQVVHRIRTDLKYQQRASEACMLAFETFMTLAQDLENTYIDATVKLTTEAPSNVADPVFSRWGTVLAAVRLFSEHWVVICFFNWYQGR